MIARSGERADRTTDFVCQQCGEQVYVTRGEHIPRCPNCGSESYNEREERREDEPRDFEVW